MTLPTSSTPSSASFAHTPIAWASAEREQHFWHWLQPLAQTHQLDISSLKPASADASFRRYFRLKTLASGGAQSLIIMDAPPEFENCRPFVHVAGLMAAAGLHVPQILDWQEAQGFMLLQDLGGQTLLEVLDPQQADAASPYYLQAIDSLIQWQLASKPGVLPPYDNALLQRELELFPVWYVDKHRGITLSGPQQEALQQVFQTLIQNNLASPSVYVHRDYMPRNLMVAQPQLGILDFQDAVYGPITYDIASLMRDAFISWEEPVVLDWTIRYWQKARAQGLPVGDDFGAFYRDVEWMGLQRHLKVLGIFARINYRDGKPKYLGDTPRFIRYVQNVIHRYHELAPLRPLMDLIEGQSPEVGFTLR